MCVRVCSVTELCPYLCDPHGPQPTRLLCPVPVGFPRQEYWSELPFPSPGALVVKNSPAGARDIKDMGWILGLGRPPEKEVVSHPSVLAREVP